VDTGSTCRDAVQHRDENCSKRCCQNRIPRSNLQRQAIGKRVCQRGDGGDAGLAAAAAAAGQLDGADLDGGRQHHRPPGEMAERSAQQLQRRTTPILFVCNNPIQLLARMLFWSESVLRNRLRMCASSKPVRQVCLASTPMAAVNASAPGVDILGDAAGVRQAEQPHFDGHGRGRDPLRAHRLRCRLRPRFAGRQLGERLRGDDAHRRVLRVIDQGRQLQPQFLLRGEQNASSDLRNNIFKQKLSEDLVMTRTDAFRGSSIRDASPRPSFSCSGD